MGEFKLKLNRTKLFRRTASHRQSSSPQSPLNTVESPSLPASPRNPNKAPNAPQPHPRLASSSIPDPSTTQFDPPSPSTVRSKASISQSSILRRLARPFTASPASHRAAGSLVPLDTEQIPRSKHEQEPQERPVTSAAGSSRSKSQPTLESSLGQNQPSAAVSIIDRPEVTLEYPTPDSLIEDSHTGRGLETTIRTSERENRPGVISTLLDPKAAPSKPETPTPSDSTLRMVIRKVWVRRSTGTATLVAIREDDLVDEAKDMILRKYGNSLGRSFDAPDITLRITPRDQADERILSPDENLCRALDKAFPGGQSFEEALLVHVPQKRTPRPSPGGPYLHHHASHHNYYQADDLRPQENGSDYFPLMPPQHVPSPGNTSRHDHQNHAPFERSIAVVNTGQLPALASPGGRRNHVSRQMRPGYGRQHTASPTALGSVSRPNRPRGDSGASADKHATSTAPPIPTPPVDPSKVAPVIVPGPRVASPRPGGKPKKSRQKQVVQETPLPPTVIDTSVPPINVLIVEDNMINMKLLEQFVRRLKVHWATAVNGREAVQKWRQGGFHLVLMDIQLPIMSGLEATREIRRLERVNHIGVLSSSASSAAPNGPTEEQPLKDEDNLGDAGRLFKSPVIIVALTASNLNSDRHEALAAGCNDFLTKPVNFVWFERKVKEWGCMQALIDFDGWRKWKDAAIQNGLKDASNMKPGGAAARRAAAKPSSTSVDKSSSAEQSSGKEDTPEAVVASK